MRTRFRILILIAILTLSACTPAGTTPTTPAVQTPVSTADIIIPTPIATLPPLPTATPLPSTNPAQLGTAVPQPSAAISAETAAKVKLLAQWQNAAKSPVSSLSFSPDQRQVLVGYRSGELILVELTSGSIVSAWNVDKSGVERAAIASNGSLAALASSGLLKVWDGKNWLTLDEKTFSASSAFAFSPDGSTLAVGTRKGKVYLLDTQTGDIRWNIDAHKTTISSVAWSLDGSILASASYDSLIRLWEPENGKKIRWLEGHTREVTGLAFLADGITLASWAWDNSIIFWDTTNGNITGKIKERISTVQYPTFSADGKLISTVSQNTQIWSVPAGDSLLNIPGDEARPVLQAVLSPSGDLLASWTGSGEVNLLSTKDGKSLAILKGHTRAVNTVLFSTDQHLLLTTAWDGSVCIWGLPDTD